MRLVTLGPKGTHSHHASTIASSRLRASYGDIDLAFADTNVDVLRSAAADKCLGVVPVETAADGPVKPVFVDYWLKQETPEIYAIGEVEVPIAQHLLVHPKNASREPGELHVFSHPEALKQCRRKLDAGGFRMRHATDSTADAAAQVAKDAGNAGIAAIASNFAAETYGLEVYRRNMHDSDGNATRFHILGPQKMEPTGRDRTAILFRTPHKPGRLFHAMGAISCDNVNMSSIHSISLGHFKKFAFYIEFEEHADSEVGRNILKRLETIVDHMVVIGSYPQAVFGN